jgi:hypothetical protein
LRQGDQQQREQATGRKKHARILLARRQQEAARVLPETPPDGAEQWHPVFKLNAPGA